MKKIDLRLIERITHSPNLFSGAQGIGETLRGLAVGLDNELVLLLSEE